MNFQRILIPVGGVVLIAASYRFYGWSGVAVATGALVMWLLLHFNRMMQVLRRAASRPIGSIDSAVMLNAKLKPGVMLLHVLAMTQALGEMLSPKNTQPEIFRWTDGSQSHVTAEFYSGKLIKWELFRPSQTGGEEVEAAGTPPNAS